VACLLDSLREAGADEQAAALAARAAARVPLDNPLGVARLLGKLRARTSRPSRWPPGLPWTTHPAWPSC
jgi:hypothetical protein